MSLPWVGGVFLVGCCSQGLPAVDPQLSGSLCRLSTVKTDLTCGQFFTKDVFSGLDFFFFD